VSLVVLWSKLVYGGALLRVNRVVYKLTSTSICGSVNLVELGIYSRFDNTNRYGYRRSQDSTCTNKRILNTANWRTGLRLFYMWQERQV